MSLFQLKNKLHLIANKSDKNIVTTEQINSSNEITKLNPILIITKKNSL